MESFFDHGMHCSHLNLDATACTVYFKSKNMLKQQGPAAIILFKNVIDILTIFLERLTFLPLAC
jgi:hypothetical protein